MTQAFPIIQGFVANNTFAWRHGEAISASRFASDVWQLVERLPKKTYVLNLCEDRYQFIVGFAASLLARHITILPPSRVRDALREIHRAHPDSYCLCDQGPALTGITTIRLGQSESNEAATSELPAVRADQLAVILFTSGSTGQPTPHRKTWGSLVGGARSLGKLLELGRSGAVLGTIPAQHMFGLETTVMLPMQWGLTIHASRPLLPADIHAALQTLPHPRWLMITPLHLRACLADDVSLPEVAGIVSATMPMSSELAQAAEKRWDVEVHEIYGSTEAGMIAMRRTARSAVWALCPGLTMSQDNGSTWVEGGHVLERQPITDNISFHENGYFTLQGRSADIIKVAGKRTSLAALDSALNDIAGVQDGSFYLPENAQNGRLVAFAVATISSEEVIAVLRQRIDPAFLPRPLYLVKSLPRNEVGKLPREALSQLLRSLCADRGGPPDLS